MALNILIHGSRGRMGAALQQVAHECGCEVVAGVDAEDAIEPVIDRADVVIDFSIHSATVPMLEAAAQASKPVVIGTTGHSPQVAEKIRSFRSAIPIAWAGNYSVGVNLLMHLTETASAILGPEFQAELVELHHRHKIDSPSGTAFNLIDAIRATREVPEECLRHGREGRIGARTANEIGVHAVRGGDVVGEHTVFFFGEGERIELTHRATDRSIFARGALRAAHWLVGRQPGLYDMRDVLGLRAHVS